MDPASTLLLLYAAGAFGRDDTEARKRIRQRINDEHAAFNREMAAQAEINDERHIESLKAENRETQRTKVHGWSGHTPDISQLATYSYDRRQAQRSSTNAAETILINLFKNTDIDYLLSKHGEEIVWSTGTVISQGKRGSIPQLLSRVTGNALERKSVIEFPIANLLHDLFTELSKRDTWLVPRLLGLPQNKEAVEKVLSLPKLQGGFQRGLASIIIRTTSKGKLNSMTSHNFTVKELVGHLKDAYSSVVQNTALSDSAKADARNTYKDLKFQRL